MEGDSCFGRDKILYSPSHGKEVYKEVIPRFYKGSGIRVAI